MLLYNKHATDKRTREKGLYIKSRGVRKVDVWAELALKALEVSPYLFFVLVVLAGAYFFFKASVKEIRKNADMAIKELREMYSDVLRISRK